jgi:hypothetical protein
MGGTVQNCPLEPDPCEDLAKEIDDLINRDKRLSNDGGTHGLKHRFREQINGKSGPRTESWEVHELRGVLPRDWSGVVLPRSLPMPLRLVALDEGPDIPVDKGMIVVGRHPTCDTRLDSIRVSRRHCCMMPVGGELEVKDLGSTNGIRINGHRVVTGRLRPGDELSIAHIRYKLDGHHAPFREPPGPGGRPPIDNPLPSAAPPWPTRAGSR